MPLYEYKCSSGHRFSKFLKMSNYDAVQHCEECGKEGKRIIGTPMINKTSRFESYESPIDGSPITNHKKRNEEMARNDCVDYEPTMKEESTRIMKAGEAALDKEVDKTVDKAWAGMDSSQRENLARDICSGADIKYLRE